MNIKLCLKMLLATVASCWLSSCLTTHDVFKAQSQTISEGSIVRRYHIYPTRNQVYLELIGADGQSLPDSIRTRLKLRVRNLGESLRVPPRTKNGARILAKNDEVEWPSGNDFLVSTADANGILAVEVIITEQTPRAAPPATIEVLASFHDAL